MLGRAPARMVACLSWMSVVAACHDGAPSGEPLPVVCDDAFPGWSGIDIRSGAKIDILFVIDDSGSMAAHQRELVDSIDPLFERLAAIEADYHIGFTTTDNGNPWCNTTPEAGRLVLSSCESRLDEFVLGDLVDARELACSEPCTLDVDALTILPTATALDPTPTPRPWLQGLADAPTNLPPGSDPAAAFRCFAPQGVSGCGFESPLESLFLALQRQLADDEPSYGFMRDDAQLAVVIVTDEVDCSYAKSWSDIFAADGNRVFWADPAAASPSSALCWNAGVACTGDPSGYAGCEPIDLDVDGNPTDEAVLAVLHPLSRYRGLLAGIAQNKQSYDPDRDVLVTLIAGVQGGGADWSVVYADSPDPDTQNEWGIAPGCTSDAGLTALPPVRMRALVEDLDPLGLWSVCEPAFGGAIESLAQRIAEQRAFGCYPGCVADRDRSTPQLEPACSVELRMVGSSDDVPLSQCERDPSGAYAIDGETGTYQLPDGADLCVVMRVDPDATHTLDANDQLSPACVEEGANVELVLVRRPGYFEPEGSSVRAECMLAGCDAQCSSA